MSNLQKSVQIAALLGGIGGLIAGLVVTDLYYVKHALQDIKKEPPREWTDRVGPSVDSRKLWSEGADKITDTFAKRFHLFQPIYLTGAVAGAVVGFFLFKKPKNPEG